MEELKEGLKLTNEYTVYEDQSAKSFGSGTLDVLATPVMIGWMENTSMILASKCLDKESDTVGTKVDISHIAATPLNMKVKIESELIKVEGRKLTFKVTAFDECEKIGEGIHERFIINAEKFSQKANKKTIAKQNNLL